MKAIHPTVRLWDSNQTTQRFQVIFPGLCLLILNLKRIHGKRMSVHPNRSVCPIKFYCGQHLSSRQNTNVLHWPFWGLWPWQDNGKKKKRKSTWRHQTHDESRRFSSREDGHVFCSAWGTWDRTQRKRRLLPKSHLDMPPSWGWVCVCLSLSVLYRMLTYYCVSVYLGIWYFVSQT